MTKKSFPLGDVLSLVTGRDSLGAGSLVKGRAALVDHIVGRPYVESLGFHWAEMNARFSVLDQFKDLKAIDAADLALDPGGWLKKQESLFGATLEIVPIAEFFDYERPANGDGPPRPAKSRDDGASAAASSARPR